MGVEKNIVTYYPSLNKIYNYHSMENSFRVSSNSADAIVTPKTSRSICNLLIEGTGSDWTSDKQCCYVLTNNTLVIKGDIRNASNLEEAREWIKSSGLYIKYPTTQSTFIPLPHSQQVKLRTFANKTNISFGCEIEGTIKAQVPKSLGATVNTHTEQINNLNKELDRVKKLEESTVSTVTTESDFTTVEATSNGYFEDVKLEGKTLVNVLLSNTKVSNDFSTHYPNWGIISVPKESVIFKENTTYTFVVNITKNTTNYSSNDAIWFGDVTGGSICYTSDIKRFSCNVGQLVFTVKTVSSFEGKKHAFSYQFTRAIPSGVVEFDVTILEGDHTQNPPSYFEGLKSVGDGVDEIVVESVKGDGNLLFFKKDVLYKANGITYTIDSKTQVITVNGTSEVDNITCYAYDALPKQLYNGVYSCTVEKLTDFSSPIIIRTYNKDFTNGVILNLQDSLSATVKKPYVNDEIAFSLRVDKGATFNNAKFKVSFYKGDIKKEYTPHQSDKKRLLYYNEETQTWEKPILREWDSIEKHADGKYYYHQRSAEVVLNGSENWLTYSQEDNGCYSASLTLINSANYMGFNVVCDKFNSLDAYGALYYGRGSGIYVGTRNTSDGNVIIGLKNEDLPSRDVAGFKTKLQTLAPITAVYKLAKEKVYECINIDLITYANETNYIVESGVLSPKTTLKVHSNISNVVSLLQKKVSLLESNMTKYMITQNRLMLASRYNADTVSFKVDVASFSDTFEYDNDLYELILNNILVGKDNYNREYIENMIRFYWMDFIISDEMYSTLFEIIKEQHNPKIEEEEETPLI